MRILSFFVLFWLMCSAPLAGAQNVQRYDYRLEADGGNNVVIRMVSMANRYEPVDCGVFYFVSPGTDTVEFLETVPLPSDVPVAHTDNDGLAKVRLVPELDGSTRLYKVIYGHASGCETAGGPWTSLDGYIEVAGNGQAQYIPHDQDPSQQPPVFWTFGMLTVYG